MSLPLLAAGEFARVTPILEQALKSASEWIGDHIFYAELADAAARQHDLARLRQYAPLAEALAQGLGHQLYQAIAHRAWGVAHRLAGEYAQAGGRLIEALVLFQALGARWQLGRTWFELGALAGAQDDVAKARESFQKALDNFESLRAAPDAERTRTALAALSS